MNSGRGAVDRELNRAAQRGQIQIIYIQFRLRPANLLESIEKSDLAIENPHAIFAVRYFQETY